MCCHCIIGQGITFFAQVKVTLAYLEEHLDIPAVSINSDDFILIQICVCGNQTKVLLAFVAVADINNFVAMISSSFTA